jgi:hypothetical protein
MAAVNFGVPDEVKEDFEKAFGEQNKSSIIGALTQWAVCERQPEIRREPLLRQISAARTTRPLLTAACG